MQDWMKYLIIKSTSHALILVIIVTFLESLAIVGLLLPGLVFMTTLGTLIGNGKLSFYSAWITGIIGCSLGDYLSYYIGWKFKDWIYTINIFKKNMFLFKKIKNTLKKYSMITIILGKLIGPTRPLIPMISGMLNIPIKQFILPSFIGCIIWPILYFIPGILTGFLINHPHFDIKNKVLTWIIVPIILMLLIFIRYIWKYIKIYTVKK